MRNLSSLWTAITALPSTHLQHSITASTFEVDENFLYVVSESVRDSDAYITVWRASDELVLDLVVSTTCPAIDAAVQVISVAVLPENRDLCLITRAGDLVLIPLESAEPVSSILGTVSPGILAASLAPDASLLVLVSAAPNPLLILMHAPALTIIAEAPLRTTDPGVVQPVSAGWGSKATQFHGSLGKQAAQVSAPMQSTTSPDDDGTPRVAWRGDAQFFAVSAREDMRRVVRVYDRQGVLQSTSENVPGLEHAFAWRPSGAVLACTQRFGAVPGTTGEDWALGQGREGRHDVVFFERNGLRHGEFTLREQAVTSSNLRPWGYRIRELAWNADSSILAVWIEREAGDVVQLWTIGNYHWYLKLEIPVPARLTQVLWHPEDFARLVLVTPQAIQDMRLTRYTASSLISPPYDTGLVAVVDGDNILLTPFRTQNVPPPMAAHRLALPPFSPSPVHIAFSSNPPDINMDTDFMAVLFPNYVALLWEITTPLRNPRLIWQGNVGKRAYQIGVHASGKGRCVVGALCAGDEHDGQEDVLRTVVLEDQEEKERWQVKFAGKRGRLLDARGEGNGNVCVWAWQGSDGAVWEVPHGGTPCRVAQFPIFCPTATRVSFAGDTSALFIGLSNSVLYGITCTAHSLASPFALSQSCTSYALSGPFLTYTITSPAHEAVFAPLSSLKAPNPRPEDFERRKVERGARIVTTVPSNMSVVLQMPRGNLETIMPRPMVLAKIRQDVSRGEYGAAFRAARKHRVDLNILVEADPDRFERSLGEVVIQLDDVEHLNLFLAELGRSTQSPETIATLCDGIRVELEKRSMRRYVHSILTAHVVKTPPDYEAALALLLRLREEDPTLVEDAVKYLIFLADADRLFDTALGMYDFSLVLLVAQHSQKDPREYLSFLRHLYALHGAYQRFAIDDHLQRRVKALQSLYDAGAQHFAEAKEYTERWSLYEDAIKIWRNADEEDYAAMLELYGDHLFERRDFSKAALAFVQSKRTRKAMVAYERALEWQALFDLAGREGIEGDELIATARRVADNLNSKRRYVEAARVLLDYVDNVYGAVAALVQGGEWSEARRITTLRKCEDLVDSVIRPGVLEASSSIYEDMEEIDELRMKQVTRLDELAKKKIEDPDVFYGGEDSGLANVDVMTDVSHPDSEFTRYTTAPSLSSNRSKRTSRSKRKLDRKAGRKGTVEEEEYLLKSLTKLVTRLGGVLVETNMLLPQMLMLSGEHAAAGLALQRDLERLEGALRRDVERIWDERVPQPQPQPPEDSATTWDALTQKVPRPTLSGLQWQISWIL